MAFEELVQKVKEIYKNADASAIQEHVAIQFNVYGQAEGKFYLEIKDGEIDIQPFEYYDKDNKRLYIPAGIDLWRIKKI